MRRNLVGLLNGKALTDAETAFESDFRRTHVVELDDVTCALAAQIAEVSLVRTLDALHLAALHGWDMNCPCSRSTFGKPWRRARWE